MPKCKIVFLVSCLIFNDAGDCLFLKRSNKNTHYKNHWQTVEGKIEKDEDPITTIFREAQEEAGIMLIKPVFHKLTEYYYRGKKMQYHFIRIVYHSRMKGDIKLSIDHNSFQWIKPDRISGLKLVGGTIDLI